MITIVPYDPAWPAMFEAERASIRRVLSGVALRIEHGGSTSVPGLAAKPVVDIQVSVPLLEPRNPFLESWERYSLSKTEFVTSVPERAFAEGYPSLHRNDLTPAKWSEHFTERRR
jgi:GrpB-like predicted nucleotidyltransferase (UPF0157 family)